MPARAPGRTFPESIPPPLRRPAPAWLAARALPEAEAAAPIPPTEFAESLDTLDSLAR